MSVNQRKLIKFLFSGFVNNHSQCSFSFDSAFINSAAAYESKNIKIKEESKNKQKLELNISKINEDKHLSVLKEKRRQNLLKKKMKK